MFIPPTLISELQGDKSSSWDDGLILRPLATPEDFHACVDLQRATWGEHFSDLVPASLLKVSQKVGGIAIGAFDSTGAMLGFLFGLSGVVAGRPAHWSHMLAVVPAARDRGLGVRLKRHQREILLREGVEVVRWTFDPLEARNAHLNLDRLGAGVESYVEEMYAGEEGSDLAEGIGTDRFIVRWDLASERAEGALLGRLPREPERYANSPVVTPDDGSGDPLPDSAEIRIEIPRSIQNLKAVDLDRAVAFRASSRRALLHYLAAGYRVDTLLTQGERRFYGLVREG
jgi:predicted GNAT superfamily acetyltransferase